MPVLVNPSVNRTNRHPCLQGAYLLLGGNRHVRNKPVNGITQHMVKESQSRGMGSGRGPGRDAAVLLSRHSSSLGFSS